MRTRPPAPDPAPSGGEGPLTLRDARPSERGAIRDLTLAAYGSYAGVMEPEAWAGLREAVLAALATRLPAQRIVAERGGVLLGSVMLFPPAVDAYRGATAPSSEPELRLLAVSPDAQGQGVGAALVGECARRAREAGARALGLHTSRSMETAMRLYRRLGFTRAPDLDFQPPGAERVEGFRLRLDRPVR